MPRTSLGLLLLLAACAGPEERAVSFLSREVPAWSIENRCFSCHNNGDAARALMAARDVDPRVLASTLRFLRAPEAWKDNGPDGEFSDQRLAALQFGFALAATPTPGPELKRAAALVAALQEPDGSWNFDTSGLPGSPVTYGRTLTTVAAREILLKAGEVRAKAAAEAWLRARVPQSVLEAGALLYGRISEHQRECLDLIRAGKQNGGWGPGLHSAPEVFDTAVVLLGLAPLRDLPGVADLIREGRSYLERTQRPDGSWPETTRPPGAESYAQRISTTGWALLALRATSGS